MPARPSLARLDTSERIKLANSASLAGSGRSLAKKSPSAMRLQLNTSMPGRSATLDVAGASTCDGSLERSGSTPLLGLVPAPGAGLDQLPPTSTPELSLQSLCRQQSQLPPSAASFGDMCLPPGARGTFAFGALDQGEPNFEISTILPDFLYLGPNIQIASDVEELCRRGVKRILNMAYEIEDGGAELQLASRFEKYLKIPMTDSVEAVGVQKSIADACRFLDDARLHSSPTYVHCKAGKSRSVTIVMAYLIHANHWTLRRSYNYVVERRNAICPNIGFVAELMKFEEKEFNLSKSSGIVGSSDDENARDDNGDGGPNSRLGPTTGTGERSRGESKENSKERMRVGVGRDQVRESMPPLSRGTAPSSAHGSPTSSIQGYESPSGSHGDQGDPEGSEAKAGRSSGDPSYLHSSVSGSYAESLANLGETERQITFTEADVETEVRGSDGRYRPRRPAPVDEVNLAPGRRATMAGLGK